LCDNGEAEGSPPPPYPLTCPPKPWRRRTLPRNPGWTLDPMAFGSGERTRPDCMIARGASVFVLVLVLVIDQGSLSHLTDGGGWCLPRNRGY